MSYWEGTGIRQQWTCCWLDAEKRRREGRHQERRRDRSWIPGMSPGSVSANLLLKMKAAAAFAAVVAAAAGGGAHSGPVSVYRKGITEAETEAEPHNIKKWCTFVNTTAFTFVRCFAAKLAECNTG